MFPATVISKEKVIRNCTKQVFTRSKTLENNAEFSPAWGVTMRRKSSKKPCRKQILYLGLLNLFHPRPYPLIFVS